MSDQQPTLASAISDSPAWAKSVAMIGGTLGVPALVLCFYFAQDAGLLGNPVAEALKEIHAELDAVRDEMQELKGAVIQQGGSMKNIAEQVAREVENRQMRCVMQAQTEPEKKACFPNRE